MYIMLRKDIEDVEEIVYDEIPYIIDIEVIIDDFGTVEGSDSYNTDACLDEDVLSAIFQYPIVLKGFTDRLREILKTNYGLESTKPKVNATDDSIYIGCTKRVGNKMFEIDTNIGFILRVSRHPQKYPYSENVENSRSTTKNDIIQYMKNALTLTKRNKELSVEFPDIDMSVYLRTVESGEEEIDFGDDIDSLVEFIAAKMDEYVNNLISE